MGKWFVRLVGDRCFVAQSVNGIEAPDLLEACRLALQSGALINPAMEILRFEITSPSGERKILSAQGYIDRLGTEDTQFRKL